MTTFYADYQWSKGTPKGLSSLEDPAGQNHFRLLEVDGGVRLEQYDGAGKFVRLIYCPQDKGLAGTAYATSADHRHRVRRREDGTVSSYEEYGWPGGVYAESEYPDVRIYNEHGRLVWQHRPRRLSDTAWDIHVLDALGKTRVVLHHTDVGDSEPCTIREEWVE